MRRRLTTSAPIATWLTPINFPRCQRASFVLQVVVYMQRQLSEPLRVFLCQPGPGPCRQHPEMVEASSTLSNIMQILTTRQLTTRPFPVQELAMFQATSQSPAGSNARNSSCSTANSGGTDMMRQGASSGSVMLPSCVVVKRQDGSCCSKIHVTESCTLEELIMNIIQIEVGLHSGLYAGWLSAGVKKTVRSCLC